MWSEAYDNFQIIYIEAHSTRELLTYRNHIIDIVKQAGDYMYPTYAPYRRQSAIGSYLTVHLSLCPRHNCTKKTNKKTTKKKQKQNNVAQTI